MTSSVFVYSQSGYTVCIQDTFGKCWRALQGVAVPGEVLKVSILSNGDPCGAVGDGDSLQVVKILREADTRELKAFWNSRRAKHPDPRAMKLAPGPWYEVHQD